MNIVIVTFSKVNNYGAMLQAYALKTVLENQNYNVKFLNYTDCALENNSWLSISGRYFKDKIRSFMSCIAYCIPRIKRAKAFSSFRRENLCFTERLYKNADEVKNSPPEADVYITGSDQVWNYKITNGLNDIYMLNFGSKDIKRISYAASIGMKSIDDDVKSLFTDKIKLLDKLSVRECVTKKEIESLLPGAAIDVVLDPTLLLNQASWDAVLSHNKTIEGKYILSYYVNEDAEHLKIADWLAERTGLEIIYFENRCRYKHGLDSMYISDPFEFIELIKNAEYIVTTSFHATVFSILFNKKFWTIPHRVTGARVTDMLELFGIQNRAVQSLKEFFRLDYDEEINYHEVNKKVAAQREKSLRWLEYAINTQ